MAQIGQGKKTEVIPLRRDGDGVVRVGKTRVRLESVLAAFEQGSTPEQIVHKFDSLHLDDVYAVITYYLRHGKEVQAYLAERRSARDVLRKAIEGKSSTKGMRERLLKRREANSG